MNTAKHIEVCNIHIDAMAHLAKQMVAVRAIKPGEVGAFLAATSTAVLDAAAKFEPNEEPAVAVALETATTAGPVSAEAASGPVVIHESAAVEPREETPMEVTERKFVNPRNKASRDLMRARRGTVPTAADLPAMAMALRSVPAEAKKRGRPRADAPKGVVTAAQREFDALFLATYPPMEGLTPENCIGHDEITVIFDGVKLRMIKRHLLKKYGLTHEDYCRIYGLGDDYPSCSEAYRDHRSMHARNQGLGTARVPKIPVAEKTAFVTPKRSYDKAGDMLMQSAVSA